MLYANVHLPGQLLDAHTDIPVFRGAELGQVPAWLLVVMRHSCLFETWRVPVATAIVHTRSSPGGAFYHYPDDRPEDRAHAARAVHVATARRYVATPVGAVVMLDADSIFHGVGPVDGETEHLPEILRGGYLTAADGQDAWAFWRGGSTEESIARFDAAEVRFTVSWKALCFEDDLAKRRWEEHTDDLELSTVVPRLMEELHEREVLPRDHGLSEAELAAVLVDEFIRFPPVE
jgi:hypothetical protein